MKLIIYIKRGYKKALKTVFRGDNIAVNGVEWTGTQVDLMEFAYGLYLTGMLVDASGRKATLAETIDFSWPKEPDLPAIGCSNCSARVRQRCCKVALLPRVLIIRARKI